MSPLALSRLALLAGLLLVPARGQTEPVDLDGDGHEDVVQEEGEDMMMEPLTDAQMLTIHSKADTDADGKVSIEEIMRFSKEMTKAIARRGVENAMLEMDQNGDGALDFKEITYDEEAEQGKAGQMEDDDKDQQEARYKAADLSGDGLLQSAELPAYFYPETDERALTIAAAATMEMKDHDFNGKLTLKEFWSSGMPNDGSGSGLTMEEKEDFQKLDTNGDNLIDLEELKIWESGLFESEKVLRSLIQLADKDGDGRLTHAELAAEAGKIANSEAQHTMVEWALHYEL